ncbi:hypothetical protein SPLC1_S081810 [Arthrospira platensis C1]|nr:hypothetical protein SPLC1_S081810 [Arthrospira platensis C1]
MLVVPARSESAIAIWARLPLDRPTGFQVIIYIEFWESSASQNWTPP